MKLRVLHSSDLHGQFEHLLRVDAETFDCWVDSGDLLPTYGRSLHTGNRIVEPIERSYQVRWLASQHFGHHIAKWLRGKPCIYVRGNHDFLGFGSVIKQNGGSAYEIKPEGTTLFGHVWAGFPHVHPISGEWANEVADLTPFVEKTWAAKPDVLVTHVPPAGICDAGLPYGSAELTSALSYKEHAIKAHFFGHIHEAGGQTRREMGMLFANGAGRITIHEIEF